MAGNKKRSWIVRVKATVEKELVCEGCTEEQARSEPFNHCVEETEICQIGYEVTGVREN